MRTLSVKCDYCGKELVVDSMYPSNYGLRLESVDYGINTSGVTYAIAFEKPIKRPKDFCGFECLIKWAGENKQ